MTASPPQVNGSNRPTMPVFGDWRPVTSTPDPVEEQRTEQPQPAAPSAADIEVARAKAWAEAEERRVAAEAEKEERLVKAQAEADAIRAEATENARRLRLANDRTERKDREAAAASETRIAESNRKRDEADRAREEERRKAAEQQKAEQAVAKEIEAADDKWRSYAIRFAIVCGIVSLPVQMSFFWNPHAPWMAATPVMLEGAAWVVHRGARAAAVSKRPVWHYRTIVWFLAFVAAAVNLYHGVHSFDPGTAIATAFASIAGPGVWDLHEHGRIRKRDGALTRRERKAAKKAAKAEAKRQAEEEAEEAAKKQEAKEAAVKAAQELAQQREEAFPKVWEHALRLAAALGETPVTEPVWRRAHLDIEGTAPGESAEVIRARNAATKRVELARNNASVNTLSKATKAQRVIQTPRSSYKPVPPRRTPGDTPRYSRAAGRAHGDLLRRNNARKKDQ